MPLTDTAIKKAKPEAKQRKLYDERGLFLLISHKGGKWWRLKYRFGGKEKRLSLGVYPDVKLAKAREKRDESRKLLAEGIDPGENRKAAKAAKADRAANSFEVVAREWFGKYSPTWAEHHGDRIIRRFERDVFPWIGGRPIADVTAPNCWRSSDALKVGGRSKPRIVLWATAGRYSATPWRPGGLTAILQATCAGH